MSEINHEELPRLAVPDFNKQEVEGIAVEAVKKEIAGGNIPVGTKLYRHQVKRQDSQGYFYVTTEFSHPITIKYENNNYLIDGQIASSFLLKYPCLTSEGAVLTNVSGGGGANLNLRGAGIQQGAGTLGIVSLSNIQSASNSFVITDTVTEL